MASVEKELTEVTKMARQPGELDQAYYTRLSNAMKTVSDDLWETLSEETQKWANAAEEAREQKQTIPNFNGEVVEDARVVELKQPKAKKAKKAEPKKSAKVINLKGKKAKPVKAEKSAANGKGRKPKFADTGKIKIVAKDNPFRKGTKSEKWFSNYKNGMTVKAAIEAGTPRHHINWDVVLGNITIN